MISQDVGAEGCGVEMEVDLGCVDGCVAEHLLDCAEIGSAFEEVSGEGVAESVGGDDLADSGGFGEVFDNLEDAHAGQRAAAAVEEKSVASFGFDVEPGAFG